ncbi:MAG: hypothetical protein H7308_19250 [Chthonomonadaceae bacterium]|nr:hypothetical protein [Chthonomonadaceae bacterium]
MKIKIPNRWTARWLSTFMVVSVFLLILTTATGQSTDDSEHEAIRYTKSASNDPISQLQKRIDLGEVNLTYYGRHGFLRSVLEALKIPRSSQMLVFSKTSFQHQLISPEAPRALYFNDNVFVGWVQNGSVLEIATTDSQLGTVFYVLDQTKTEKPKFVRQTYECLQCHDGGMTKQVPGYMMRSIYTRVDGMPEFRAGTMLTTDSSPMQERWGGWYVTGKHGAMRHLGNAFVRGGTEFTVDTEKGANLTDLRSLLDTTPYLSKHSDIVALMVAEHQANVYNLITRANYATRIALEVEKEMNKALGRPANYRSESTTHRIEGACDALVNALLFVGEASLRDRVTGTSGFAEEFARKGPFDRKGRSLRQFDLKSRLMRYPLSYLIYSDAFGQLPTLSKEAVFRKLYRILGGEEKGKEFASLSSEDKKAIYEILKETCPDFALWLAHQSKTSETFK